MNNESIQYNKENHTVLTKDNIEQIVKLFNITSVELKDDYMVKTPNGIGKMVYTDTEHPFVIFSSSDNKFNRLYVNSSYFEGNIKTTIDLIKYVIKNTKSDTLDIEDVSLINDEIINEITQNKNIKNVSLAKYRDIPYILTKKDYIKFKQANIKVDTKEVSDELNNNFDDIIVSNSDKLLFDFYTYKSLKNKESIEISNIIKDKDLDNFKYINKETKVVFSIRDNINETFKYLDKLNEFGINNYVVNIYDKEEFNNYITTIDISKYPNLTVRLNYIDDFNIKDYVNFESILYQMIEQAMNLSPFEKYIYAYNITKKFKVYKENNLERNEARDLYSILVNEYMVCVGYKNLLGDLLKKLGIDSLDMSLNVDSSYDNVNDNEVEFNEAIPVNKNGHARRYVYLNDPKYGIDGYYVTDPTWDNSVDEDNYVHMLMTDKEADGSYRYSWKNSLDLFDIENINEYIIKIKNAFESMQYRDFIFYIKGRLSEIETLDKESYNFLLSKYDYIKDMTNNWPDNITDLVYDIGNIILKKVNKSVSGETLFKGIREIYLNAYGYTEDTVDDELEYVREHNMKLHSILFPIRKKVDKDGNEIILSEDNKFDFELKSKSL